MTLPLMIRLEGPAIRRGEPVTRGIPFPRSLLRSVDSVRLQDQSGESVPLQCRALAHWPDGSVRWLLLDWQLASSDPAYRLGIADGPRPTPLEPVAAEEKDGSVELSVAGLRFRVGGSGSFPFAVSRAGGEAVSCRLNVTDGHGRPGAVKLGEARVEETGPLRAKACFRGAAAWPVGPSLDLFGELDVFAGTGVARLQITLRNPQPAAHPGGAWDLGSGGSAYLSDVSLSVALAGAGSVEARCSPEPGHPLAPVEPPFELYQDSSGGEYWKSRNHIDRHRQIPLQFRGYKKRDAAGEVAGLRATPIVTLSFPDGFLGAAMPRFWENFPKAVEVEGRTLTIRLFPKQSKGGHEIQGGEQKTHVVFLAFAPDNISEVPLDWCREPVVARADPEWHASSGAVQCLTPRSQGPGEGYERLVDSAIEGPNRFEVKREVIDEYGWRHFGDIYGDHEAVRHEGPEPLVSHFNNQYDPVFGFGVQYLRTGDVRWWKQMDELAWHVIDIDIYHTDGDKPAYNNGLFWHTVHYIDADTATHRTYPRRAGLGGGPANEQNYATGLVLHHYLTGSRLSRETAIGLGRWVIDMDDGGKSVFGWLASGRTGLASCSRTPDYHGPGRGSGNSLAALIDVHQLTGGPEFLAKAEEIIRRVIHPADDVAARDLLDTENRWFYTMFLQALGKYLHHKGEIGEVDWMYAYARASLLHYARWMATSEYPYLDKPERLEFPTETWAAQDMRKCEVFWHAWLHAEGAERERFRERARHFHESSVNTLSGMSTRHLCRPVVLMLAHGFRQAWFERHPQAHAPRPAAPDFGRPEAFEPLKARALRRLKLLVVLGGGTALLALSVLAWLILGGWNY